MDKINFTETGGYRFKQNTLAKMQAATMQVLATLINYLEIPNTGNFIIDGCEVVGANITDGYLYIDGDLCFFEQTAGDLTSIIKKIVTVESLVFKNGAAKPVFRSTTAGIGVVPDGVPLMDFERIAKVREYNLPSNIVSFLHKGSFTKVGPSSENRLITFPDVGTINYIVMISGYTSIGTPVWVYIVGIDFQTSSSFKVNIPLVDIPLWIGTRTYNYMLIPV